MFRNRRRAASNPASRAAPPSSSASLAATKAFLRDRDSNGALSSAAAAAALRTHTPTPTPVGETVTKRMMRRGSGSSHGSGSQRPTDLRRHSSSGSMTERSFRAPSPARSSPIDRDAPPVPAVPKEVRNLSAAHHRASSLEPPLRGGSPVGRGGGRGVSLDRGVASTPGRGQQRTSRLANVIENEPEAGAPPSVNFSRPISPQQIPSAKVETSLRKGQSGWFGGPLVNPDAAFRGSNPRPKTSDGISSLETERTRQAVRNAADRPVATKKTQLAHGVEGARLSSGSMRARPSGAAVQPRQQQPPKMAYQPPRTVDPNSPFAVYDPSSRTFIHKGDAIALHKAMSEEDVQLTTQYPPPRANVQPQSQAPQQRGREQSQNVDQRVATPPQRMEPQFDEDEEYEDEAPSVSTLPGHYEDISTSHAPTNTALERQLSEDVAGGDVKPVADNTAQKAVSTTEPDSQSPKFASNLDSPYPRLQQPLRNGNSPQGRGDGNQSLSPPRNAHFAPLAVEMNGVKHQPLPRSVSPGKSALKASPSTSRRSYSPASDDGVEKKKKNVRVSFEEAPVVAGTSAYADSVESPTVSGLAASRWSNASEENDMDDYSMTPRPELPSFGSIRDSNRRSRHEEPAEKVTETVTSSLSASAVSASEPLESSSDHVVGGILAQDFAAKKDHQSPLPPEVTTVEGTGYASDTDESTTYNEAAPLASETRDVAMPVRSTPQPEPKTLTNPVENIAMLEMHDVHDVPVIAVQPATPLAVEKLEEPTMNPEPEAKRPFVPGGWDDADSDVEEIKSTSPTPSSSAGPSIRFEVPPPREMDAESTDDDSIYSDAYEDFSDSEEGFGSINAIVQSPISKPASGLTTPKHAVDTVEDQSPQDESPINAKSRPKAQSTESWESAQQRWSEINKARKQAAPKTKEDTPMSTPIAVATTATQETPVKAAQTQERHIRMGGVEELPKVKAVKSTPAQGQPRKSALKKPATPPQTTSSSEPQLKKSMRDSPASGSGSSSYEPRMRKSMRNGTITTNTPSDPHLRKTMRGASQPGLAASRYSAPPVTESRPPKGTLQKKHIPAMTAVGPAPRQRPQSASGTTVPKRMTPVPTYDSDSDASASSFQRQRPRAARKEGGRYTMRGSMRSGPAPTMRPTPTMRPVSPPTTASPPSTMRRSMRPVSPTVESPASSGARSSRFSIRSLSPAGRFRPKVSMNTAPSLPTQGQPPSPRKSLPAFGKKGKTPPVEAPKLRFKSRIVDSSDEEEDTPRRFQSRFADSDDSDGLDTGLTPVRGIPKRPGEEDGDSTDLEDEVSDTEAPPPDIKDMEKGKSVDTNGVTNGQGSHVASGSLRNSKYASNGLPTMEAGKKAKTKRGFFGLGKKKAPASYLTEDEADSRNGSTEIPMPTEHRNRDMNRPLTPIGEDNNVIEHSSRSPKLQRRPNTPTLGRSASDSWPIPQTRPKSADGPAKRASSLRPAMLKRHSSHYSATPMTMLDPKTGKDVIVGRSGKKKKFQGLRRVFGLND